MVLVRAHDFLVMAASLVLDGVTILPARGDLIEVGSQQFEVLALPGEREYRPSDPQGILLRIHTKLRKAEP